MPKIDLTDPAERQKAVQMGYIWSAPEGAIRAAFKDMKAGLYPVPSFIPNEWVGVAQEMGVKTTASGFSEGQGPS